MADYSKAEHLYQKAIEINRQVLGENHPDYATSLNNLAPCTTSWVTTLKAEPLYQKAIEINRQLLW